MRLEVLNANVVVVAAAHNPAILHHSFLLRQGIIDPDLEPDSSSAFTTPAVSRVSYPNGIEFTVQGARFQVADDEVTNETLTASPVAEYAAAYVRALPHVPYQAVGVNLAGILQMEAPEPYIRERFLRGETVRLLDGDPTAAEVEVGFQRALGHTKISISSGGRMVDGVPGPRGVIVQANYNRNLDEDADVEAAVTILREYPSVAEDFLKNMERIFRSDDAY